MKKEGNGLHLVIKNLKKTYGKTQVLKGIDLEIAPGEFVAIVGKSGCGKSTLLRHLAGLEHPTSGAIIQDQEKLASINKKARFMFQDARLLPWEKIAANVGVSLGLKGDWREKATIALRQVGLENRANEWPSVLSGGQRQRVSLARALVTHPQLLLLDEPLGALDALTRIEMQELIEAIWQEHQFTAILVTHDVGEAVMLADRIILIEDGKITMNIKVDLPRPRDRGNSKFGKLESTVLTSILKKENTNLNLSQSIMNL